MFKPLFKGILRTSKSSVGLYSILTVYSTVQSFLRAVGRRNGQNFAPQARNKEFNIMLSVGARRHYVNSQEKIPSPIMLISLCK